MSPELAPSSSALDSTAQTLANRLKNSLKIHSATTTTTTTVSGNDQGNNSYNNNARLFIITSSSSSASASSLLSASTILYLLSLLLLLLISTVTLSSSYASSYNPRVVRLCIASSDPIKLSSQCVLCDRHEFPLTVIGCTGYTRMTELTASLLSVRQATCLIYNCRKQLPSAKPQPFFPKVNTIRNPIKWLNHNHVADASQHEKRYLSSRSAALVFGAAPAAPPGPPPPRPIILTPYIVPFGHRRYNAILY